MRTPTAPLPAHLCVFGQVELARGAFVAFQFLLDPKSMVSATGVTA